MILIFLKSVTSWWRWKINELLCPFSLFPLKIKHRQNGKTWLTWTMHIIMEQINLYLMLYNKIRKIWECTTQCTVLLSFQTRPDSDAHLRASASASASFKAVSLASASSICSIDLSFGWSPMTHTHSHPSLPFRKSTLFLPKVLKKWFSDFYNEQQRKMYTLL